MFNSKSISVFIIVYCATDVSHRAMQARMVPSS